jgi:hypothetical protein
VLSLPPVERFCSLPAGFARRERLVLVKNAIKQAPLQEERI